jgi:hypothetical protein
MSLIGGGGSGAGGAGNVAGSNPAGVGTSLNYVGNLVYAYSGDVTLNASLANPTTLLEFTTGAELIFGNVSWGSDVVGGNDTRVNISINNQRIFICRYSNGENESNDQPLNIIIPPFSKILIAIGSEVSETATAIFTGEIHA